MKHEALGVGRDGVCKIMAPMAATTPEQKIRHTRTHGVRNVKCVDAQHASNGSCACQCRIVTVSVKWRWCWVVFVNTISREIVERWRGERCVCGVVM